MKKSMLIAALGLSVALPSQADVFDEFLEQTVSDAAMYIVGIGEQQYFDTLASAVNKKYGAGIPSDMYLSAMKAEILANNLEACVRTKNLKGLYELTAKKEKKSLLVFIKDMITTEEGWDKYWQDLAAKLTDKNIDNLIKELQASAKEDFLTSGGGTYIQKSIVLQKCDRKMSFFDKVIKTQLFNNHGYSL
ncbi:hypothetical protein A4G18_02910 [Pasteurellaceae bacterium Pebbles2]|nr:hypothetical protein [Pasteurellaceae bacterium Pebbles2]